MKQKQSQKMVPHPFPHLTNRLPGQHDKPLFHFPLGHAGHVQVTDTPNGLAVTVSHSDVTAEDVATSALTQMAQRVVIENYGGQATNWPQHSE